MEIPLTPMEFARRARRGCGAGLAKSPARRGIILRRRRLSWRRTRVLKNKQQE